MKHYMYYADYKKFDFVNGEGIRHSLFVSGCSHRCKGCFNAPAWNRFYGKPYTLELESQIIEDLKHPKVRGLSLLGGEPFENLPRLIELVDRMKSECGDKDVWAWSGYTFEEILEDSAKRELLERIDILVDGRFILEQRDLKCKFRGSSNQRVIDVKKSLVQNEVVLYLE